MTVAKAIHDEIVRQCNSQHHPMASVDDGRHDVTIDGLVKIDIDKVAEAAMRAMPGVGRGFAISLSLNPDGSIRKFETF